MPLDVAPHHRGPSNPRRPLVVRLPNWSQRLLAFFEERREFPLTWGEQDGIVGRVTSTGAVEELALPQEGSNPDAIAAGPGHTMWVTETGANAIAEITA